MAAAQLLLPAHREAFPGHRAPALPATQEVRDYYTWTALQGPDQVPRAPLAVWETDVHSHAMAFDARLRKLQSTFRAQRAVLRKQHLSDATKALIVAKKSTWLQLHRTQHSYQLATLRECFNNWSQGHGHCTPHELFSWQRQCHLRAALLHARHRWLCRQVVPAVRADDKAYCMRC